MDKILRINMSAPGGPVARAEGLGDYAGLGGLTAGVGLLDAAGERALAAH